MKSKNVTILLALFLGGLGVHKFYLNKPIQGIFYILFFWTYIPAIVALIEGIGYLLMSEEDFNKVYNKTAL